MGYQILAGSDETFDVIEYPTHAQEQELHRLFVRTGDSLVAPQTKSRVCDKWGWEMEDVVEKEITDKGTYHLELAKVIFEDASGLGEEDIPNLRGGLIQEAREDFIEGCFGRSGGQDGSWMQALQRMVESQVGQNATGETRRTTS